MALVLVVDDDPKTVEVVRTCLQNAGYVVDSVGDGEAGLRAATSRSYDLVILDVVMPKMRGFDLCRELRAKDSHLPILFLSSQADVIDRTLGLELGADDYLTKPFAPQELVARVGAILRRYSLSAAPHPEASAQEMYVGTIRIDFDKFAVTRNGSPVHLTATEFRLLACLATNADRTLTRDELREAVWGDFSSGIDQTITTTLSRLRTKLEDDPSDPRYIVTVRGFGYRLVVPGKSEGSISG